MQTPMGVEIAEFLFGTFCTVTVPLSIYMFTNRRQARTEQELKHQQNVRLMSDLMEERKYYPAHEHFEKTGNLTAEGMRRTKTDWK